MQPQEPQDPNQQPPAPVPPNETGYGAYQPPAQQPQPQPQPPQPTDANPAQPDPAQSYEPHVDNTLNGRHIENPLESMQPGERVICEIRRHPIGIIPLYAAFIIAVVLIGVIGYGFGPSIFTDYSSTKIYGYVSVLLLVVAALGGLFSYVAHVVYWGNRWVVTDDSVTQIIQTSLFSKQSSQLSMANLEDITAEKNGIFQQLFNFGVLRAETAGAQKSKFHFYYCPNPEYYAKCILSAREVFEGQHYRNQPNQAPYVAPAQAQQPPQQ